MLIDLDRTELPPHRTPLGHSLLAAFLGTYLAAALAALLAPADLVPAALATATAFGSHLVLDSFTRGGIFLWPRAVDAVSWLEPVPSGRLYRFEGAEYLDAGPGELESLREGALSWPCWLRWPVRNRRERPDDSGAPALNLTLCLMGLAGVLAGLILA